MARIARGSNISSALSKNSDLDPAGLHQIRKMPAAIADASPHYDDVTVETNYWQTKDRLLVDERASLCLSTQCLPIVVDDNK